MVSRRLSPLLFQSIALLLFGIALATLAHTEDTFNGPALLIVIAATALTGMSLLKQAAGPAEKSTDRFFFALLVLTLIFFFTRLPMFDLYWLFPKARPIVGPFCMLGCICAVLAIAILIDVRARFAPILFVFLLAAHLLMGLSIFSLSRNPHIDVYVVHTLAEEALTNGSDPYAITFPDIYGRRDLYPPGLVVNGQVQCGYSYLPMSLLLALPAYIAGDVRYSNLICLTIAAALIGYARPSRRSFLAAILCLFLPGIFHILENDWMEPQMAMLLAAIVFVWVREIRFNRIIQLILFGLLLAVKQYMVLAIPLIWMLAEHDARGFVRSLFIVAAATGAVLLPFFLWNPNAFMHSTTALFLGIVRTDGASIPAWLKIQFGVQSNLLITAGIGLLTGIGVAWRAKPTPAIFAAAMSFVLTMGFLFSTQAFLNYYFLSACTLCMAIAVGPANFSSQSGQISPSLSSKRTA